MRRRVLKPFVFTILAGLATLVASNFAGTITNHTPHDVSMLAYHNHPPTEVLPATLDPSSFKDKHSAFVVYTLASQIKDVLYQVPCYCPCHKLEGHQSLLDCYTSKHGVRCPTCQKEAIFCYLQHRKGKNVSQIRKAIAKGKAWKLDLFALTQRFYSEIQANGK